MDYYDILWATYAEISHTLTIEFAKGAPQESVRVSQSAYPVPESVADTVPAWIESLLSRCYGRAKRNKNVRVLINPAAGPGGASKIYNRWVKPIFEAARLYVDESTTTKVGEGVTVAKHIDVDTVDAVVTCSGDGLAHEVFNGLGERADARLALSKVAVCQIPCGSGNAMSMSLFGTVVPSRAALAIVKGLPTPLDLVSVTHGDSRRLSFLSQAFGIVADLDLGTESMRFLGHHRFMVGFLWLVMNKKQYPCDVAVKVEIGTKPEVKAHYREYRKQQSQLQPSPEEGQGLPPLRYGTIKDDLPEGWVLVPQEKLRNFYCGNVS